MKLEEEIKQKSFPSEIHKALVNILYTGNWLYALNKKGLKDYDLSPEQYNVLRILRGQHPKPATVMLINERMLDKMSNVSRLVEKLRKKELVERKECKNDRRQVDILITDKGLQILKEIDEGELPKLTTIFEKIGEKKAKILNEILDDLRT